MRLGNASMVFAAWQAFNELDNISENTSAAGRMF
jgi:hypothetical protein